MRALAIASLLVALLLVSLSAYLRLDHSGIGCEPWPQCYGNIGVATPSAGVDATYQRLLAETHEPLSWATPAHRLAASVLGLMIVALFLLALINRRDRVTAFLLLLLTVFLALLGVRSGGLHSPAVVVGNLVGGFAMLGLLGWLVFRNSPGSGTDRQRLHRYSLLALIFVCLQIFLGALTSANFAASACRTLPDCHGSWLPGKEVGTAFDLTRELRIGETGFVIGGAERADIQKLHRLSAILATVLTILAGVLALRSGQNLQRVGTLLIAIVMLEFTVGVASVAGDLPIILALAHNSLAALLLLTLVRLLASSRERTYARL